MAPRPSSPTISYLPAFVTVGIVQSICRAARAALATQTPVERMGSVLGGKEPDCTSRPSIVNFLVFISGNASADTPAPYPPRYPLNFRLKTRKLTMEGLEV